MDPLTSTLTGPTAPARLRIDPGQEIVRIAEGLRRAIAEELHRAGAVIALSGGIDSSVSAALAVRAIGARHVIGLALPERDSDPQSLALAQELAAALGIELVVEDLTPLLDAAGCYARRDEAIRRHLPYGPGWRSKLVVRGGGLDADRLPVSTLVVQDPSGAEQTLRLTAREHRAIVAATNFKQRARAMAAYHHADRRHYAVIGTPNRLEYELGFFVKGGDGLADVKPIAHLYKCQVYQLADALDLPEAIRRRPPTTDTYSLPQSQEEFFFAAPMAELDLLLHGATEGRPVDEVAGELGLEAAQVARAYREIERKRQAAHYLHALPILMGLIDAVVPAGIP